MASPPQFLDVLLRFREPLLALVVLGVIFFLGFMVKKSSLRTQYRTLTRPGQRQPAHSITPEAKALILAQGPLGLWRTASGTAAVVIGAEIRFREDGTGVVTPWSGFSEGERVPFFWFMRANGLLALRYADIPDGPDAWAECRLAFRVITTDICDIEVLSEADVEGFWFLTSPICFIGP